MKEEKKVQIQLEKHLWPDEILEIKRKRRSNFLKIFLVISIFTCGFLTGGKLSQPHTFVVDNGEGLETSKLNSIMNIMENQWFFKDEIENINEKLMDDALYGMTDNDLDLHTTYMSSEEVESFTTGIDMGFVGIGVQYNATDGLNVITRVFHNSPADKAGVLPGDRIYSVDGIEVEGLDSDVIASKVKGEEGSTVVVGFLRDNEYIELSIVRAAVVNTAYGEMLNEEVGYLQIYQFGSSTGYECEDYLNMMSDQGLRKLIIDVRDDGGGYLEALVSVASLFVPKDTVVMQQVYSNGTTEFSKATSGMFENIDGIVILVNGNSASAAEVLTIGLKELRDDVTILGTTTYGKGTVQVTHSFADGSALKYTTSKWLSPSGVWVNGVGITPDLEVKLHDVLYTVYADIEDQTFELDTVSNYVKITQNSLDFLGYEVDRQDGYYDQSTYDALVAFQDEFNLEKKGVIDSETFDALTSQVVKYWSLDKAYDAQLQAALEVLND